MSCHGCAAKFGFWTKESGCPNCGFSFCSNCLKNKCSVPKLNNKVSKVCKSCCKSITELGAETTETKMANYGGPPDLFLKRVEALDAPKPPISMYCARPRMRALIEGMNSTDLEILRRLEKLREDRRAVQSVPTDDEIARRLAQLRGQDSDELLSSLKNTDTRSKEQQTQDLLKQFKEEAELNVKLPKPEDEISARLRKLRNRGNSPQLPDETKDTSPITLDEIEELVAQMKMESATGKQLDFATVVSLQKLVSGIVIKQNEKMDDSSSADEDEDNAAAKILTKVQAEVELERSLGIHCDGDNDVMDVDDDDAEELPWCIICNEDANVRCLGCDRDLYCNSCFQEGHKDEDTKSHAFEIINKK